MDIELFGIESLGQLVPITGTDGRTQQTYEHYAFIPDPMPEQVALSDETHVRVGEAAAALARLDGASSQIPNPGLLRRPALRREAQSTSALEGIYEPFETIMGSEPDSPTPTPATLEILNYLAAAEIGFEVTAENPLTAGLLKQLQRILVEDTPSQADDSGELRSKQVMIGAPGGTIFEARFVPPPPGDQLAAGLDGWETWVNSPHPALAPITQAALAHYQFETLHPFSDGNGRIGRLAIMLQLRRLGAIHSDLLTLSPWFERHRRDYLDHLLAVSQTGHWEPWVRFFCAAVEDRASVVSGQIVDLLACQRDLKQIGRSHGWSGVINEITDDLIGFPVFTARSVSDKYEVTFATASRAIDKLVQAEIVTETTGRSYDRRFAAQQVLTILAR